MPRATRRTAVVAAPTPRERWQGVRDFEPKPADNIVSNMQMINQLTTWHRELARVTSTLCLSIGKGMNRNALAMMAAGLRVIANEMERSDGSP